MDVEAADNDSDPLYVELNENLSRDTAEDAGPKTDEHDTKKKLEHESDKVATKGGSCVESEVVAGSANRKIKLSIISDIIIHPSSTPGAAVMERAERDVQSASQKRKRTRSSPEMPRPCSGQFGGLFLDREGTDSQFTSQDLPQRVGESISSYILKLTENRYSKRSSGPFMVNIERVFPAGKCRGRHGCLQVG